MSDFKIFFFQCSNIVENRQKNHHENQPGIQTLFPPLTSPTLQPLGHSCPQIIIRMYHYCFQCVLDEDILSGHW